MDNTNILIVEDDHISAQILMEYFEGLSFKVKHYSWADDVMKSMEELRKYDLISLDLMMLAGKLLLKEDNYEGLETGERLYKIIREKYINMPIVIVTAKSLEDLQIRFLEEPHTHLVFKPINTEKLVSIKNFLQRE